MFGLTYLVRMLFSVYLLGLLTLVLAGWIQHPVSDRIKHFLNPFYSPFLTALSKHFRPVPMGSVNVDITPWLLFVLVMVVRELVTWILS